ncbi:MAG: SDR family NAD(P)-dependent oxidoreductase, partial [Pseudomonadota bacterium]|nr:SDR family NAD(P)-dependent oxidoreductase [Pseudomonadota bacterium]
MTKDINLEGLCILEGRVSIITGPAKGMGAAITLALANAGSDLVLVGRDLEPIKIVAQKVRKLGRKAKVVKCDITSDFDVSAMCKKALEFYGQIDILVNIAGGTGPLGMASWETTPKDFDQIIDLNLKGCFLTMREVLPTMIAQRYGKIVNVGG